MKLLLAILTTKRTAQQRRSARLMSGSVRFLVAQIILDRTLAKMGGEVYKQQGRGSGAHPGIQGWGSLHKISDVILIVGMSLHSKGNYYQANFEPAFGGQERVVNTHLLYKVGIGSLRSRMAAKNDGGKRSDSTASRKYGELILLF